MTTKLRPMSAALLISATAALSGNGCALFEREDVAGTFTVKYVKQDALPVADEEGHVIIQVQAQGQNQNASGTEYMKGAKVLQLEQADLVRGNGPHNGYCIMDDGRNQTFTRWEGMVTTVIKQGQPLTTFEGTWVKTGGTGKYKGVSGEGSYAGHFIAKDQYVVEWTGELDY
jgi:hypothetical protein